MGTKNNPGAFDCYAAAHPDEPMFILLGRDKHAPTLVWLWATLRELDDEDPAKVDEARQCSRAMSEWNEKRGRRSAGIGQAGLAAVLELIRQANRLIADGSNAPTSTDEFRAFLCASDRRPGRT